MGACGGVLATGVHFINQKLVKTQSSKSQETEDKKFNPLEYAKIFILMSLLVGGTVFLMNKKNNFLKKKLLGGSIAKNNPNLGSVSSSKDTVYNSVRNTSSTTVMNPTSNLPTLNTNNVNLNMTGGGKTISSTSNPTLELSDINDEIHTGMPNF